LNRPRRFKAGGLKGTGFNAAERAKEKEWVSKHQEEQRRRLDSGDVGEVHAGPESDPRMAPFRFEAVRLTALSMGPFTQKTLQAIAERADTLARPAAGHSHE
jgi:hypothetical protein